MRDDFTKAVETYQTEFGIGIPEEKIEKLADFFEIIRRHNALLHLVGPMSSEEFAIRHILESLTLLQFLPKNTIFADIGAGGGLPSIPCLLLRDDLRAVLIDSKLKKTKFLEVATAELQISNRVRIVNRQFEEVENEQFSVVTCRALDKFTAKLPRLLKWSQKRNLLLFGGNNLRETLKKEKLTFGEKLMPLSDQRFLFIVSRG